MQSGKLVSVFNVLRLLLVLIFFFFFLIIYYFVAPGCSVASFDMYCVPRVRNKHIIIIIIIIIINEGKREQMDSLCLFARRRVGFTLYGRNHPEGKQVSRSHLT